MWKLQQTLTGPDDFKITAETGFEYGPAVSGHRDLSRVLSRTVHEAALDLWCEHAGRTLSFSEALIALRDGRRIRRKGWNGKGMWLVLIHPGNAMHTSAAGSFPMLPCIGMKTAPGDMQPGWLASQTDMLADDWEVVEG